MASFSTGLSALSVNQRLIDLAGQNVANADTPGYHRQVGDLASIYYDGALIGQGVELRQIKRLSNNVIEKAHRANASELAALNEQLTVLRQIEAALTTPDGSLDVLLENVFNQLERLSAQPDNLAQRRIVIASANGFADALRSTSGSLHVLREGLDAEATSAVRRLNFLAARVADLNGRIRRIEATGTNANDLRDQRFQALEEIAELVDVRVVDQDDGIVSVLSAGAALVTGTNAYKLRYQVTDSGDGALVADENPAIPFEPTGGKLGGIIAVRNDDLAGVFANLNTLAQEVIARFNEVHATGVGLSGPASVLAATQGVSNAAVPLADVDLSSPVQAGSLFLTVTDQAAGTRRLHEIAIDPVVQSLQDVAASISALPNVQAVIDTQTGTLTLLAAPGNVVDFSGLPPTDLDLSGITGTTVPELDGVFAGSVNEQLALTVGGSGTVGVTPGLSLEVRNGTGVLIDQFSIGQDYEPGSALEIAEGVTLQLSPGTANVGDAFTVDLVAAPDTTGLLAALGIGGFFVGTNANDVRLRADLLDHPERLNASRTGDAGDNSNLLRLTALRDGLFLTGETQSFREYYLGIVGDVAGTVEDRTLQQSAKDALGQSLFEQRQAIAGVDPNEELIQLLKFQRAFEMAAKYLTVVNETLGDLIGIIR